jgi:hypothetical protein
MNILEGSVAFLITLGVLEMIFWIITLRSINKIIKWIGSETNEEIK